MSIPESRATLDVGTDGGDADVDADVDDVGRNGRSSAVWSTSDVAEIAAALSSSFHMEQHPRTST